MRSWPAVHATLVLAVVLIVQLASNLAIQPPRCASVQLDLLLTIFIVPASLRPYPWAGAAVLLFSGAYAFGVLRRGSFAYRATAVAALLLVIATAFLGAQAFAPALTGARCVDF